jgi:PAS domain S-box-containing protein
MGLAYIARGVGTAVAATVTLLLNVIPGGRKRSSEGLTCEVDLQSVLQTLPEAVFLFDEQARIVNLNTAAERLAGQSRSQLFGVEAQLVFRGSDADTPLGQIANRGLRGEFVCRERQVFHTAAGENIEVLLSVGPVCDVHRRVKGALLLVQDVSELRALQRQADSGERHFVIGQMTAGLVHDFSNVLNTISQAATVLDANPPRSDRERDMLGVIDSAVRRGSETVGNIRDYLLGGR